MSVIIRYMAKNPQALATRPGAARLYNAARDLVLDAVSSENTRRVYRHALDEFGAWLADGSGYTLTRQTVQAYRRHLETRGGERPGRKRKGDTVTRYTGKPMSPSSINLRLSAIRKLARVVADVSQDANLARLAEAVARVESLRHEGVHVGRWLTLEQAEALVNAPDVSTLSGLRDRALLAVLIGAGLRRAEAVALERRHLQQRAGRWAIVNLRGKRSKERTVPVAGWVFEALDAWLKRSGITEGRVFRTVTRSGELSSRPSMSTATVWRVVLEHASTTGVTVAPHDLRRTYARLARDAGAPLEQIRLSLGHASIKQTEDYIGSALDYANAPSDRIRIRLGPSAARAASAQRN